MTKVAIVGYGNVGRGVLNAIKVNPDMELAGIISRNPQRVLDEGVNNVDVYSQQDILEGKTSLDADVAILCGGSKKDLPIQGPAFARMYNTLDSFDTHSEIPTHFKKMDDVARANGNTAVICGGWDPGVFSRQRIEIDAILPGTVPEFFYGLTTQGGLSQGHSDAIRQIDGVVDARQYTHARTNAIERVRAGEHPELSRGDSVWRECVVVIEKNTPEEIERIEKEIKNMPAYFDEYKTTIEFVSQEFLDEHHQKMPHDGLVLAVGKTGDNGDAQMEYRVSWESNPGATGNILVPCARACYKFNQDNRIGAYTMADLSPADMSPHSREKLLENFI
ncbi:MAG: diaminopimelate dehydrogenase [Nanoarchaeota archaeon]|nr:diaminopimelate dehydrogenase [Nanoarchaeota archaeon]